MLVHHSANLDHWLDQLLRRQDIPQPQRRVEDLTHCARVDNTAGVIKPLQARERGTGISKCGMRVCLKYLRVAGGRKLAQASPLRGAEGPTSCNSCRWREFSYLR